MLANDCQYNEFDGEYFSDNPDNYKHKDEGEE